MDDAIRIVVEKVAIRSQEVIKRDTITSDALQCPTSIGELGRRHTEQRALLEKDNIYYERSRRSCLTLASMSAPRVGTRSRKTGRKPRSFMRSSAIIPFASTNIPGSSGLPLAQDTHHSFPLWNAYASGLRHRTMDTRGVGELSRSREEPGAVAWSSSAGASSYDTLRYIERHTSLSALQRTARSPVLAWWSSSLPRPHASRGSTCVLWPRPPPRTPAILRLGLAGVKDHGPPLIQLIVRVGVPFEQGQGRHDGPRDARRLALQRQPGQRP